MRDAVGAGEMRLPGRPAGAQPLPARHLGQGEIGRHGATPLTPTTAPDQSRRQRGERDAPRRRPGRAARGLRALGSAVGIEPGLVDAAVEEAPADGQDQRDDDREEDAAIDDMVEAGGELDARSGAAM